MPLRSGVQQALRGAALLAALGVAQTAAAQAVPTDAAGGCPISPATVGTVTLNGVVKPADSTVALAPNCGFFQWTEQSSGPSRCSCG